jgi:peroxiredoxin
LPQLEALYGKYAAEGVVIILVDASNRKELTEKIIDETAVTMPVLLDDEDISGESYGVFATPTTVIVDSAGRMIFKHIGFGEGMEDMFEKEIELLLERQTT